MVRLRFPVGEIVDRGLLMMSIVVSPEQILTLKKVLVLTAKVVVGQTAVVVELVSRLLKLFLLLLRQWFFGKISQWVRHCLVYFIE